MFQLSLVDHIRLSFGGVATSYRAHSRAAERLAARAAQTKVIIVLFLGLAAVAGMLALLGIRWFQIAAASLSTLSVVAYAIHVSLAYESRSYGHRACAAQLWLICEKYWALLAEVHDGLIEVPAIAARRDQLIRDVHVVYEHALPADRDAYQIAREALGAAESPASDKEIDRLLPASLRQPA